jgi:hypothetical protein
MQRAKWYEGLKDLLNEGVGGALGATPTGKRKVHPTDKSTTLTKM